MKIYSLSEVSKKLSIPKDTLRYYDKIGIFSPERSENGYRIYGEGDLLILMNIQVMKYADFSLAEIKEVAKRLNTPTSECDHEIPKLLEAKRKQTLLKINHLEKIVKLFASLSEQLEQHDTGKASDEWTAFVLQIFEGIKSDQK